MRRTPLDARNEEQIDKNEIDVAHGDSRVKKDVRLGGVFVDNVRSADVNAIFGARGKRLPGSFRRIVEKAMARIRQCGVKCDDAKSGIAKSDGEKRGACDLELIWVLRRDVESADVDGDVEGGLGAQDVEGILPRRNILEDVEVVVSGNLPQIDGRDELTLADVDDFESGKNGI